MPLSRLARGVATVQPDTTLSEAARLMDTFSVGALVIADSPGGVPVGIVTDRDIVRRIGRGSDPTTETVACFAGKALETIGVDEPTRKAVAVMRKRGVRRIPIVDERGHLAGIVSLDDVLLMLSEEMADVAGILVREFAQEHPVPAAHERSL